MNSVWFLFNRYASNRKLGPMPVTTSPRNSCPDTCQLKDSSCYARFGPLAMWWNKVSQGIHQKQVSWGDLLAKIKELPPGTVWRHNQAGDLVHDDGNIDKVKLRELAKANSKLRGFTYTHHLLNTHNIEIIKEVNKKGFVVNVSLDRAADIDLHIDNGIPLVTILPKNAPKVTYTEGGVRIVKCPATWRKGFNCSQCDLCMRKERDFVVGFPVHGVGHKKWKEEL